VCELIFFCQAEDGIRDWSVTGVQTCALPIYGFTLATRSAKVKPSCDVTKLTLAVGRRPSWRNRSLDAASRSASSPGPAPRCSQKLRTVSRKRSFHSDQPGGKAPTW